MLTLTLTLMLGVAIAVDPPALPTIEIDRDNVEIVESCIVRIGATPMVDKDNNGVIHITRGGITVDFANQRLHGATADQLPDSFAGIGIKITAKDVTLKNAKVFGYKVGIHALNADGLTIHDCDVSNNFHQRLKSTPQAEDASDWLWPHANDNNEWMTNYGAGICVEDSSIVRLYNIRARKTQNGIILDRVNDSRVYDCDCSFLSGWGLAMWRSNKNVISRNAFDFCVRGYSHGVYNRGQDSAGILMFEQCSENVIAENSVTHGGDGIFGFAGKEALGERNHHEESAWYHRRGCNGNQFYANDCSYAVAHGLELTFSFDNQIWRNVFASNAICGIWGGYSQRTSIHHNVFRNNGEMAYGQERGGMNIEHGVENHIFFNVFHSNKCGVFLWDDDDPGIMSTPWAQQNNARCARNSIEQNTFHNDTVAIQLRRADHTRVFSNEHENVTNEFDACDMSKASLLITGAPIHVFPQPPMILGDARPVGARKQLAGRENIIMTEWGPWDHESPLLRFGRTFDHADEYRLFKAKVPAADQIRITGNVRIDTVPDENLIIVRPLKQNALQPYVITFEIDSTPLTARGTLTGGTWEVWTFKSACDPREDLERWRREGTAEHHTLTTDTIDFRFGGGGMTQARGLPVELPRDHFGVIATRSLTIPAGKWRVKTTSDDGVRVWMDDQLIIDDWTWHGPTRHDYELEVKEPREYTFRVEYFELDGYAVLELSIEPI